jgi:hypothetical protein
MRGGAPGCAYGADPKHTRQIRNAPAPWPVLLKGGDTLSDMHDGRDATRGGEDR